MIAKNISDRLVIDDGKSEESRGAYDGFVILNSLSSRIDDRLIGCSGIFRICLDNSTATCC